MDKRYPAAKRAKRAVPFDDDGCTSALDACGGLGGAAVDTDGSAVPGECEGLPSDISIASTFGGSPCLSPIGNGGNDVVLTSPRSGGFSCPVPPYSCGLLPSEEVLCGLGEEIRLLECTPPRESSSNRISVSQCLEVPRESSDFFVEVSSRTIRSYQFGPKDLRCAFTGRSYQIGECESFDCTRHSDYSSRSCRTGYMPKELLRDLVCIAGRWSMDGAIPLWPLGNWKDSMGYTPVFCAFAGLTSGRLKGIFVCYPRWPDIRRYLPEYAKLYDAYPSAGHGSTKKYKREVWVCFDSREYAQDSDLQLEFGRTDFTSGGVSPSRYQEKVPCMLRMCAALSKGDVVDVGCDGCCVSPKCKSYCAICDRAQSKLGRDQIRYMLAEMGFLKREAYSRLFISSFN